LETQDVTGSVSQDSNSEDTSKNTETQADKDLNFKQLRESRDFYVEELERSRESVTRANEELAILKQTVEDSSVKEDEDDSEFIDKTQLKALKREVLKESGAQIAKAFRENELQTVPRRLEAKFKDFYAVVSNENLKKLEAREPEIYKSIRTTTDFYSGAVTAYKSIKNLNLNSQKDTEATIDRNSSKPGLLGSVSGSGSLHEASRYMQGLSPAEKQRNQKEMRDSIARL
jgi:hypothetical protein